MIGINYFNQQGELRGCINDVRSISEWLFQQGFQQENALILTDDARDPEKLPTRANIIAGMNWLVEGAAAGDSLFFEYSGHGGTGKDKNGDEVDGQDETICPMDYASEGQITDDEMHTLLVKPLPKGCHLTCIYDSCHSGSALDLPYTYTVDGNLQVQVRDNTKAIAMAAIQAGLSFMNGDTAAAFESIRNGFSLFQQNANGGDDEQVEAARQKMLQEKGTEADVVQLSGCRDEQTSADAYIDGSHKGAMSFAFMKTLNENTNGLSYTDLLRNLRGILKTEYSQIPQMSTGHLTNMDSRFAI